MGDNIPPPPPSNSTMANLYYGFLIAATATIILAMYNVFVMTWCSERQRHSRQEMIRTLEAMSSGQSSYNSNIQFLSSYKYKKEQGMAQDQGNYHHDCPICLSAFEEGEEVRRLPTCKHAFHAPCIDMWLYSHFDCPVCRAPVNQPPVLRQVTVTVRSENSEEGLPDIAISV